MKVCVTATSGTLDAQIDPRFGRCAYFVIVDMDSMKFEALPNVSAQAMHGAGVQAAQIIANKGVQAVITGSVGPNAHQVLSAGGIKIIIENTGTVREVIARCQSGKLQEGTNAPNVSAHFGMGMGRGMGRRGMRAFGGADYPSTYLPPMARWQPPDCSYQEPEYLQLKTPSHTPPQDELEALEDHKNRLSNELESINARINELKNPNRKKPEDQLGQL